MSDESKKADILNQAQAFCKKLYDSNQIKGYKTQWKSNSFGTSVEILITVDHALTSQESQGNIDTIRT